MRSIGKRNIKKVKELTLKVLDENKYTALGCSELQKIVKDRLPVELWDTWEMADQEINRIIYDTTMEKAYS